MTEAFPHSAVLRRSPAWFRLLNKAWSGTYFAGTKIRLDKDHLISSARKITGLTDLGKEFNDEPLDRLLQSVEKEAELHPVGRFITRQRFISLLSIRLRAEFYFNKFPEILDRELYPAWIIIGLQRTGTTKLQRLLAVDPDHRVIPSWEVINPVPLNLNLYGADSAENPYPLPGDKRIGVAKMSVNALKLMSPGFFAIHPIDVMQPEEDILMLDVSFLSTTPEAMMHVPTYASWLEKTDQSEAYAYAVKLLKFLQWIKPARRWILKTPHHLEFPDLIAKHFAEVRFLWPHRKVYESVPSFASMVTYNHMIFSDRVDPGRVARHWVRKTGYMLDKALDYRMKDGNDAKFTDIFYHDLITDSGKVMQEIYRCNGGTDPALLELFHRHEQENPHRKFGKHQYSLADFGLTEADIDLYTGRYRKIYYNLYDR